jgi:hypothetical protein
LADDAARSKDREAELRTRIDSANWANIKDFDFVPTNPSERLNKASAALVILIAWLSLATGCLVFTGRRLGQRAL